MADLNIPIFYLKQKYPRKGYLKIEKLKLGIN
jgi:hypothetical protein